MRLRLSPAQQVRYQFPNTPVNVLLNASMPKVPFIMTTIKDPTKPSLYTTAVVVVFLLPIRSALMRSDKQCTNDNSSGVKGRIKLSLASALTVLI